jgi:hypothetical protein
MCWRPHFVCLASLLVKVEFFFLLCSQVKPLICRSFFSRWLCYIMQRPLCNKTSSLTELQGFGKKLMCLAFPTISFQNTLNWLKLLLSRCLVLSKMNGDSTLSILWKLDYQISSLRTWVCAPNLQPTIFTM